MNGERLGNNTYVWHCPRCGTVRTNVIDWDHRICPWCYEPIDEEEEEMRE